MKRALFWVLILVVVSVGSFNLVWAAQGPPRPDPRVETVRAYLRLDDQQFRSFLTLLQTRAETIEPLLRTLGEQERQLARLLRDPNAEPAAIGSVVIVIRNTRGQIEAAEDVFRKGFLDILNEDQKRKLTGLERFIENQRAAPAFLSLGLIEVDLGPEPQRTIQKSLGLDPLN
ncbi:MAG: periplasmic heavy metal sensor [Acidobacteria bacterium]|nr:periplasmic heavy metal sensor [Acidobacteriota bacterium]